MNMYIFIALIYVIPAIIFIGMLMWVDNALTLQGILIGVLPVINIAFLIAAIAVIVGEIAVLDKVIWRKKCLEK